MEKKTTIVLADDHAVVRSGLRLLLDSKLGFEVIAEAADATEAKRCATALDPDVLVLDLSMPGRPPLEVVPEIRSLAPRTGVVALTMEDGVGLVRTALEVGFSGYVLKEAAEAELVSAIEAAARGETYVQPDLAARLNDGSSSEAVALSEREREVLRLIGLGHTNAEIAQRLFLSIRTVEDHRSRLNRKLEVETRAQLVRLALARGLVRL